MIVGPRPYVTRDKLTRRAHDYGMWMCVPMNIPRRPTTTLEFWEWHYAVGAWSDCSRQTTVAEVAVYKAKYYVVCHVTNLAEGWKFNG